MATSTATSTLEEKPVVAIDEPSDIDKHSSDAESDAADVDYTLSGAKLYIIIFGLSLAVFLMALDMSILATAIPLITEKFQSTEDIGWYFSAYSLSL
jgi:hypothetical protein